jgi:hypothetical protein
MFNETMIRIFTPHRTSYLRIVLNDCYVDALELDGIQDRVPSRSTYT